MFNKKTLVIFFLLLSSLIFTITNSYSQDWQPQPVIVPYQPPSNMQNNNTKGCGTSSCKPMDDVYSSDSSDGSSFSDQNVHQPQQNGPNNILIILDASHSMAEKINGEKKITIAKRVMNKIVREVLASTNIGMCVYGHKVGFTSFNVCKKTELLVPIGSHNAYAIMHKLNKIKPKGATPISYAIEQAVLNDFIGIQGRKKILLISDGMETCGGDPCRYAVSLVRQGIDLKLDVVGFDLKEKGAFNQLKCIALTTHGKFYTTDSEASLTDSLRKSIDYNKDVRGFIVP